ncbi:transcription elongation factor GreA [bacterium]|nr:transcription elongation factor GreA [bacterium]
MANEKPTILTEQGKLDLEQKLNFLKTVRRSQIADRIRVAREFGDISENAEYESAKNEQGLIEGQISDIEHTLQNCKVITIEDLSTDAVSVGTAVTFVNTDPEAEEERYTMEIVGTREANPQQGRISNECPLGEALIGHGVGDIVDVRTPSGLISWKIEDIVIVTKEDEEKKQEDSAK